jgi:thymidylate kinase
MKILKFSLGDLSVLAFSGPDGTGKTSCANFMTNFFSRNGYHVKRVWIKNVHSITFLLITFLGKLSPNCVIRSTSGTFVTSSMAKYRKAWLWIELAGILLKILSIKAYSFMLKLNSRKKILIADRYLLDSMVHITISLILSKNENGLSFKLCDLVNSLPFKILRSFLFRSTLTIFLDGEVPVLLKRNIMANKADSYEYMSLQRHLYKELVRILKIPCAYINTTGKSLNEVCSEVLTILKERRGNKYFAVQ